MMHSALATLYGLKWNPFSSDLPVESLLLPSDTDSFFWRIENHLLRDGGFGLIEGDPGSGKSVTMRQLAHRLERVDGLTVAALSHTSSRLGDFYREMGELFAVSLSLHNRWGGFKALRERWLEHLDTTRIRPLLLIDEAQELPTPVFSELRLLAATDFDSRAILSVIFAGDARLKSRLDSAELLPLKSRIRYRLTLQPVELEQLAALLDHILEQAGNPALMSEKLKEAVCYHAAGNPRSLAVLGDTLLSAGCQQQLEQLDETLFHTLFGDPAARKGRAGRGRGR